ncbi:MAG TPA: class I SAM-dependent methyltransferase [Noviherbaspirillum sp.]|uniref:SAM-dependent methyltransferase n=1 Tax=Noviherbaspirillum sp. TaxID=1926288 RepID=UPI002D4EE8B4|nr:class I SAM-dependent methyltransferase [Noviherbaspirillum sp.]HYD95322.1 class I SAM-dependent methyltransferase [Noviherbaspirillum sp.]
MIANARTDSICHARRRSLNFCGLAVVLSLTGMPVHAESAVPLDVPYVPTPQLVAERMLKMARVGRSDVVYDLGCGDGRLVITAAKKHGARGVGIDIDPARIRQAQARAKAARVENRVEFILGDLFQADLARATVVTLYLLPRINRQLRPQLWQQLAVGTRVVSHGFDMGEEWPPERTETVDGSPIYYWTITEAHKKPAKG